MQIADNEMVLLLKKAQAGDTESLQKVCINLKQLMRKYFIKRFYDKNLVDDLIQETYLRILNNILSFKEPISLKHFVLKVSFHVTQDYFRQKYRRVEDQYVKDKIITDQLANDGEMSSHNEANVDHLLGKLDLERAMEQLPEKTQRIFQLKVEGYKYDEIAEMLNISVSGVKMQIKRGVQKLKILIYNVTFWVFRTIV